MKCWNNFWVIVHLLLVHVSNTFDIKSFRTLHINAKKSTWTLIVRKSPSAEIIRYLIHDTCWKPIQFFCVFVHCTLQNVMLLQGEKHKRRRNASSGKRTYIPFWPTYFLEFVLCSMMEKPCYCWQLQRENSVLLSLTRPALFVPRNWKPDL